VYYAAVRLLFCSACTLGWMTYPTTYVAPVKMGVDTLVDVLLETPAQAVSVLHGPVHVATTQNCRSSLAVLLPLLKACNPACT
jgi:hypothetical protein